MTFDQLLADANQDQFVVGLILLGSRGKGFETQFSDHDLMMVVGDSSASATADRYAKLALKDVDLKVLSQSAFQESASWNSPEAWDRYTFAHVQILLDRLGTLAKIVEQKGRIPPEHKRAFIEQSLDGYINAVVRSIKCFRNGNIFGARLEAITSVLDLLTTIFALESRHRPFPGYVELELQRYPLQHIPWAADHLTAALGSVLDMADIRVQQRLLKEMNDLARSTGYGHIFDAWDGVERWAMNVELPPPGND